MKNSSKRLVLLGGVAVVLAGLLGMKIAGVIDPPSLPLHGPVLAGARAMGLEQPARRGASTSQFDLTGLTIPRDKILSGGPPKDGIPSITDPPVVPIDQAEYLDPAERVVGVTVGGASRAYPLRILNWHEAVNDTLGGIPIAVIYCPLCDSVSVVDRRVDDQVLEFGISGLLYNSNVLLYDRTHDALWSQVAMAAVSGPMVGRSLRHLPWRVETAEHWTAAYPDSTIMTLDTGHMRNYGVNPYADYFDNHQLYFPVAHSDDRLPFKTRVVGIEHNGEAAAFTARWVAQQPGRRATVEVGGGAVELEADDQGGAAVVAAPESARAVHTFWFAWNAFHPETSLTDAQPAPGEQRTLRDLEPKGGTQPTADPATGDRPPGAGQ